MNVRIRWLVFVWLFVPGARFAAPAAPPPDRVDGTVEAARADQLVVRGKDGKVVPFRLDAQTQYEGGRARSASDLERGRHVVVHFRTAGSEFVAERVVIRTAGATSSSAHDAHGQPQGGAVHDAASGGGAHMGGLSEPMAHDAAGMMETPLGGPFRAPAAVGSGTSLLPATSPEYMWHRQAGSWMLMTHGDVRLGFNRQGGPRGVRKVESQNWLMVMADRDLAGGRLALRGMFSAEEWTTPRQGFPQLLQTGETLGGRPIVDAQHVHDLFMELSIGYARPLSESIVLHVYGGPAAEPALGPTAFMHRASAGENPAAPLSHHVQDSTHITHGVMTGGVTVSRVRVEGSIFRGREPDEKRADLELGALDSWSGRVTLTPTREWSLQISQGRLKDPEAPLEPGNIDRTTASAMYTRAWTGGHWASTVIWGRNHERHGNFNAYLLESALTFRKHHQLYARFELLDKAGLFEENIFDKPGLPLCATDPEACERPARVGAATIGAFHDFVASERWMFGIGGDVTMYRIPAELAPVYGTNPRSVHMFVRVRPGKKEAGGPAPSAPMNH